MDDLKDDESGGESGFTNIQEKKPLLIIDGTYTAKIGTEHGYKQQ